MEAIVLAGGFGTRLSHIVSDVPKPMALVNGKPFLVYILNHLKEYNFKKVVLAVGYKSDSIKNYFKNSYKDMEIIYSDEDTPLGTGGAIKKALQKCNANSILITNGDTFFDVNLAGMKTFHNIHNGCITIAVKTMYHYDRYGSVIVKDNKVIKFIEKKETEQGIINAGMYYINKQIFCDINNECFSFEKMILESLKYDIYAFESNGYFIDIGIPEDYYRAQKDFANER
jgi:D-glycero-alpha-D-manno-heptose 1-phosphate guanylyltransferase